MTTARPAPSPSASHRLGVPGRLLLLALLAVVGLGSLRRELLGVVDRSLQPSLAGVWLRDTVEAAE